MNEHEAAAAVSILVRELDAVRAIAISAQTEVNALRARVAELEAKLRPSETEDGRPS